MPGRYLLTFEGRQIVLLPGPELVAGRGDDCAIQFDDPQVSRRHAAFVIEGEAARVRDLGSRNGIAVNGEKAEGTVTLEDGDHVMIGSHAIRVESLSRAHLKTTPAVDMRGMSTMPPASLVPDDRALTDREELTQGVSMFDAFLGATHKALTEGRIEDAQTSMKYLVAGIEDAAKRQKEVEARVVHASARHLLALAAETLDGWHVERLLSVHRQTGVLVDDTSADGILALLPRLQPVPVFALRTYVAAARRAATKPADAERLRRLEHAAVTLAVG
jgi:pSer/pThr/pTyr-binding forkhead associated (FHA) protein